jgi:cytochrome c oxidase subunit 3
VNASASPRLALDVSDLPSSAFGHHSVMWWATMCMVAIEGTAFALAITSYLYLKGRVPHWPPTGAAPDLLWGSVNVAILLASALPNALAKKAAERFDLSGVRLWMAVCCLPWRSTSCGSWNSGS